MIFDLLSDYIALFFWVAILVLIGCCAFFSASETALAAASRSKLKAMADKDITAAQEAINMVERPDEMAQTLMISHIITNITITALVACYHKADAPLLAAALMMIALLICGTMIPKNLARHYPERTLIRAAPIMKIAAAPYIPLIGLMNFMVKTILRICGQKPDDEGRMPAMRDDIAGAISLGHSEGAVEKEDRDRLLGALHLTDRTIEEVMRHRRDIEMINADLPAKTIISQILASPHSRLPIYRDEVENIVGILHVKDLLREVDRLLHHAPEQPDGLNIMKLAMKPYFVPETTTLDEQMREFLKRRTHFALVVDEYGTLQGLITLEDIIEEIIGDIHDEFDVIKQHQTPKPDAQGNYLLQGSMTIRDANRALDWHLPDDEANTIAGLIIHEAQIIPNEGQIFSFHGFRFEIAARHENRLALIKMRPL